MHVRGYLITRTTFGEGDTIKTFDVRYMVVNVPSSYNIFLGGTTINKLGAVVSLVLMKVKCPYKDGLV